MPETSIHSEAVRDEIAELERLLQEKRDTLAASSESKPEKEVFQETYRAAFNPPAPASDDTSNASGSMITTQLSQDFAGDLAVVQGS